MLGSCRLDGVLGVNGILAGVILNLIVWFMMSDGDWICSVFSGSSSSLPLRTGSGCLNTLHLGHIHSSFDCVSSINYFFGDSYTRSAVPDVRDIATNALPFSEVVGFTFGTWPLLCLCVLFFPLRRSPRSCHFQNFSMD